MKPGSIGEFALIDRIRSRVPARDSSLLVGIGDDGAVIKPAPGMATVAVTDMLVEGVHFDLAWHDLRNIGRKSLNVNISDIVAMGGIPRYALLSLAIPSAVSLESLDAFIAGFQEVCAEGGIALAGGDTSSSLGGFYISVTLLGEVRENSIVRRSGASPGDTVFVTGTLGNSAAGLLLLQSGKYEANNDDHRFLAERHLNPRPRRDAAGLLVEGGLASAMIDISDGLSSELHHIARASGVGISVRENSLPCSSALMRHTAESKNYLLDFLLHGGEEYEICFTVRPEHQEEVRRLVSSGRLDATEIGSVKAGSGVSIEYADGREDALQPRGFEHFTV